VAGTHDDRVTGTTAPDGASTAAGALGGAPVPGGAPEPGGTPGAALLRLVEVMDTLRVRCPWDAKQTHESLAPYLLEECYEALEALESGDPAELRDELGDVLLQVVFHARVAAERTDGTGFTIDDVANGIVTKLVRRHPHVFSDVQVSGPEDVKRNWDAIKAGERGARGGSLPAALGSVPFGQPALSLAAQLQRRAERAGVPAELTDLTRPAEGAAGASAGAAGASAAGASAAGASAAGASAAGAGDGGQGADGVSEIGAALFALVARARAAGADPELELRAAARSYRERVRRWAAEQERDPA
jgi:NTP pyrophosphatase (non-canonical NTP hydrolase)